MAGQLYKIGLVITIKDRYEYTRQTLIDLKDSNLLSDIVIVLIDDGSQEETSRLLQHFPLKKQNSLKDADVILITHGLSTGVAKSLQEGWDLCINEGCTTLCNLDNDVRLKPDWLIKLLQLQAQYPDSIITGFNANNPAHRVLSEYPDHIIKSSIGGINMLFSKKMYLQIRERLIDNGWDWQISDLYKKFIVTKPSVVQHTGLIGIHSTAADHIDIAEDF